MCHVTFPGQKVKGQRHICRLKFLACPIRNFVSIWWSRFIHGTNTINEWAMRRVSFPGQKVKCQGHMGCLKFLAYPLHTFVPIWWLCYIRATNATHQQVWHTISEPKCPRSRSRGNDGMYRCIQSLALSNVNVLGVRLQLFITLNHDLVKMWSTIWRSCWLFTVKGLFEGYRSFCG